MLRSGRKWRGEEIMDESVAVCFLSHGDDKETFKLSLVAMELHRRLKLMLTLWVCLLLVVCVL